MTSEHNAYISIPVPGRSVAREELGVDSKTADSKPSTPREVELKFQLPSGGRALLESSAAFAGVEIEQYHQLTTYFDTADNALDRVGWTLRVRRSGENRIQTVKTRGSERGVAASRGEWEWLIKQDEPDIGRLSEIREMVDIVDMLKERLLPVFITDIQRTTRTLHLNGATVELAIDEGSIEAGTACEPVSELELELKSGLIGPVYQLAADLQAFSPFWILSESKAARGWHLRNGRLEHAREAQAPDLGRSEHAADGFRDIVEETLGHLIANIGLTLRGDIEGLHQMRVALRRARAALKLFNPHLKPAAEEFGGRLQRIGQIFGRARDWDVFCAEALPAAMADLPSERLQDLNAPAEMQRQIARAAVKDLLQGQEFTGSVLRLAAWVEAGVARPSLLGDGHMEQRLVTLAPSLLDLAARKIEKRGRHPDRLSVEELHALRKSLRKLYFDVEYISMLYPHRRVKEYRHRCKDLQNILGQANDAVMATRLAQTLLDDGRSNLAQPIEALSAWSEGRRQKALHGLERVLREFSATPNFWHKT